MTHGSGASAAAPGVFARYAGSALLAAAAVGVTVALGGAVAQTLFVFSFAAVSLAAWFGGTGPAALAAVLCMLGVDYYLLPPVRAFTPTDPGGLVPLAAFLVVAALLATLTASLRAARDASTRAAARLAAQTRDLEAANEQLQEQAVELEAQQAELEVTAQQLHEQQAELEIRAESLHEANANLESALADAVRARRDAAAGRAAAAAAEARLRDAFGQAPAGIAVTEGPEHRFVLVNARAEAVVGRRDLVGRTYAEAFPEFAAQGFVALLDRVYATGEPYIAREARVVLPQPEGSAAERFYDFVYQPLRDESGGVTGILQHAVDVSDQVQARAQTERLQALTAALAGARTVEEVAAVVVAEGVAATGAATGMLAVRPAGADDAVIVRQHGLHPDVVARYARFPLTAPGPAAACLRTGEPQWAESRAELLARYPDAAAVWDALGTETVATVPLAVAGPDGTPLVVGAMSYGWTAPRPLGADDRAFFLTLGRQAAQAVERTRLLAAEQAARAAAEELAAFFGAVLTTAPVGIAVYDRWLRYAHINDVLAASNRVPAAAHLGRTVAEVRPDLAPALQPLLTRVLETGAAILDLPVSDHDPSAAPDAPARRWRVSLYPVRGASRARRGSGATAGDERAVAHATDGAESDGAGPVLGVGVVAEDVTERQRLLAESEAARRAAEEARAVAEAANRAKGEFLATMSHELRTPLNAIAGYAELLALGVRGPLTEAQSQDMARIRRANQHLTGLVTDVLNFARLEAGQVEYHVAEVHLGPLVADLEALVGPQLAAKRLAYDHDACGPDTPAQPHVVRADAEKVRQVLVNLLSNAIKFTDAGGRISLACEDDAPAGVVRVRVTDTGRGIPPERLAHVFEPFVQVDRDLTHTSQQGVGLGLAISRDLARGMGGELSAESIPGEGSTFTLTLPRAPGPS